MEVINSLKNPRKVFLILVFFIALSRDPKWLGLAPEFTCHPARFSPFISS